MKDVHDTKSIEECNQVYHMSDPWYMVFCNKKKGHKGLHSFSFKEDGNPQ